MKLGMRFLSTAALAVALVSVASAAEVQGILLDKMCSAKIAAANDQAGAKQHTKDCALMDPCVKSGYGVLTADGKFIQIDPAGNDKIVKALKASKKDDNLRVQVQGEQSGDSIKIASIKFL